MMAENLVVSWDRITPDLIDRAWEVYKGEWGEQASDESDGNDEEFRPHFTVEDLQDLS
jgi:hypothetical protein